MKRIVLMLFFTTNITISFCYGQVSPVGQGLLAINSDVLKAQLGFLASDWTEGRMAGEKGAYLSADYIASMLQLYGVKPGGDFFQTLRSGNLSVQRTYFQNFVLLKTSPGEKQILKVKSTNGKTVQTTNFSYNVDFSIRVSDPAIEIEAPVVFAGYGIINTSLKYNDFSKTDVKGKFILRISGIPKTIRESTDPGAYTASLRETETALKNMGAIGIIEFDPSAQVVGNPENREFLNFSSAEELPRPGNADSRYSIPGNKSAGGFLKIIASVKTANEILDGTGINIDDYIKSINNGKPFILPQNLNKTIYLKTTVITTQVPVRNIIGIIEGKNPEQVIVLGAHYDHMGIKNGYIWNGADDNGSGTAGVMTLAKALMATGKKPDKTIVIALWTAEEEGLLGSRYFIKNPTYPLKDIKLNVNFDMISRYISDEEPDKVTMTYTDTYPVFRELTATNIKKYGIDLSVDYQPSADPPGGTDHRSFVAAGIPIMRFKPGHREEYHTPFDEINTINWDIMEKIIKISFTDIWELANTEW